MTRKYISEIVPFLLEHGADTVRHGDGTLLDHLFTTAGILSRWKAPEYVCKAGLLHSIYSTQHFKHALLQLSERQSVIDVAGVEAEKIAHLFCTFDRKSLYSAIEGGEPHTVTSYDNAEKINVTNSELAALTYVTWANALEQIDRGLLEPQRETIRSSLAKVVHILPPHVIRELEISYDVVVHYPSDSSRPGICSLLNIEDPSQFIENARSNEIYVAHGALERLSGLCDYDLEELLEMKRAYVKAFRVINGKTKYQQVERGEERSFYESGFTLYFHSLYNPRMGEWVKSITNDCDLIPGVTRVSAFASKRGKGLKTHYDQNDNFVCQAQGTKRWRVAKNLHVVDPTVGYTLGEKPTVANIAEAPLGYPAELPIPFEVIDLRPGTVMYMPHGMWHDTETTEDSSLHFNIQCGTATWKDVVEYALARANQLNAIEELRTRVKYENENFDADLRRKLELAFSHLQRNKIDREDFHRYVAQRYGVTSME